MTAYNFSALSNGQVVAFNPGVDSLFFDIANLDAASGTVWQSGADLFLSYQGKTVSLTNTALAQVSSTGFSFANGSKLLMGDDTVGTVGDDGANTLTGTAHGDYLDGLGGADTLAGGAGNDVYVVDNTGDKVVEKIAQGVDTVLSSLASYTLPTYVEILRLQGNGNLNGIGNSLDNTLVGNSGNNQLNGGIGADTLQGGAGNDLYFVDNTGDAVVENPSEGNDTVASSISYTLPANVENLTLIDKAPVYSNDFDGHQVFTSGVSGGLSGIVTTESVQGYSADGFSGNFLRNTSFNDPSGTAAATTLTLNNLPTHAALDIGFLLALIDSWDSTDGSPAPDYFNVSVDGVTVLQITAANASGTITYGGTQLGNLHDRGFSVWPDRAFTMANESLLTVPHTGSTAVISFFASGLGWQGSFDESWAIENLNVRALSTVNGSGNALDNVITGNAVANVLDGGAGNDTLDGGVGADTLRGGIGDDLYIVDDTGDIVVENASEGNDTVRSSITYYLPANVENVTLTGTHALFAMGNELDNTLVGNSIANKLDGGAGADMMKGGAGDDIYIVDNGSDNVVENPGAGNDTVISSVSYSLSVNIENLSLIGTEAIFGAGNALNNLLVGNDAANTLDGGAGNDILDGGTGADSLRGGIGNDLYFVDNTADSVVEFAAAGSDTVISSVDYTLPANVENLSLTGAAAINGSGNDLNNLLTGNDAANTLDGGKGNDTLDGGAGADTLRGGLGNNIYIVDNASDLVQENSAAGIDTVKSSVSYTLPANVENLTLTDSASNYHNDFDGHEVFSGGVTGGLSGAVHTEGVQGYTADGFSGNFLRNDSGGSPTGVTTLTLDNLPTHAAVDVDFLLALIDSWDSDPWAGSNGPDYFNVTLDGVSLLHIQAGDTRVVRGFGGWTDQAGVDMSSNSALTVPHTASTLTLQFFASSDAPGGFTGGADESWGIENLAVTLLPAINGTGNGLTNTLTGNDTVNTLDGGAGNDTLLGAAGDDTLIGGPGVDKLDGGAGTDTIAYTATQTRSGDLPAGGSDTVLNGAGDHIDFSAALENVFKLGGTSLSSLAVDTGVGAVIDANNSVAFDSGFLRIDLNGDGAFNAAQDFQISLAGVASVTYNAAGGFFNLA